MEYLFTFVGLALLVGLILLIYLQWQRGKNYREEIRSLKIERDSLQQQLDASVAELHDLRNLAERLQPYSELADADTYAETRKREGDEAFQKAHERASAFVKARTEEAEIIVAEAKVEAKKIKERQSEKTKEAERILSYAYAQSARTQEAAKLEAEKIAGDAYYALENARTLQATASAMADMIHGYGDKYLVSSEAWVDELAENWTHKQAGLELKAVRIRIRQMTEGKTAATSDYADETRRDFALRFVIDAFNGKIDSILAKARHSNYGTLSKQVKDAYQIVNHHGKAFRDTRITEQYLECRMTELYWVVGAKELEKKSREEQRAIREAIREEERARKEYEKAIRQAEKEEQLLNKMREQARAEMQHASEAERLKLEGKLSEIEEKLREAEEKNQRALSMAQQTKRGHVYIISNVGSFGENVYKIGMTRRLEPLDRVKELGDASVPFLFDVHAIIFSEDAPGLESELHRQFEEHRVNRVNHRKEFFRVSISDVKEAVATRDLEEVHWTLEAEATEYRETLALQNTGNGSGNATETVEA